MAGRHVAPHAHRTRRARTILAAIALASAVALTSGASASTTAGYSDQAAAQTVTATYTVPPSALGAVQVNGTGWLIDTRLAVTCDDQSSPEWRFRDRVAGTAWHGWLPWSTAQSEPGWTGWVTSGLGQVGITVETQWEVRCTTGTWIGTSQTSTPTQIVRTT
ncbi:MAG: hypothetical protein HGA44_05755 [Cellulomonadaceae bacterium]|nr:hypothetical protein [Cellulomonadaceae bacterium]